MILKLFFLLFGSLQLFFIYIVLRCLVTAASEFEFPDIDDLEAS